MMPLSALIWPKRSEAHRQMTRQPKPTEEKIAECTAVLKRFTQEFGVWTQNPSLRLLRKRMGDYWRSERCLEDRIPLVGTNKTIVYRFPRWAGQQVDVMLRAGPITHSQLPADLAAEVDTGTQSAPRSDPECPSPSQTPG